MSRNKTQGRFVGKFAGRRLRGSWYRLSVERLAPRAHAKPVKAAPIHDEFRDATRHKVMFTWTGHELDLFAATARLSCARSPGETDDAFRTRILRQLLARG